MTIELLIDKDGNIVGWWDTLFQYGYKTNHMPLDKRELIVWNNWILPKPIKFPRILDRVNSYYLIEDNGNKLILHLQYPPSTDEFIIDGYGRIFHKEDGFIPLIEVIELDEYSRNPIFLFNQFVKARLNVNRLKRT